MGGIEPPTPSVWKKCSTTELHRHCSFGRTRTLTLKSVVSCAIHYTTKLIVVPTGLEPILFWTKTRRVANYTTGQFKWDLVDSNHSPKDKIYSLAAVSERLSVPNLGKEKMVQWTSPFTISITLTVKTPPQLRTTDTLTLCTSLINLSTTGWARTTDTWFWRPVLYQLSYRRV